ncbi:hypothetical protein AYI68_g868 [Smittium mucronatum]|uniref:Uncharacterized protein n=1 Tax=Smittium mucronatum TaxID=133383 RepID=A0A1R0H791_9FUNG|nr:hypothetical protein AYI68_g868 [Smittium mucronatum]
MILFQKDISLDPPLVDIRVFAVYLLLLMCSVLFGKFSQAKNYARLLFAILSLNICKISSYILGSNAATKWQLAFVIDGFLERAERRKVQIAAK